MARKEPDPPHELDPLKGGLKHNPFAALKAKAEAAGVPIAPAPQEKEQAREAEERSAPRAESKGAPRTQPGAKSQAPASARITVRLERTGRGGKAVTLAEGPGLAGRPLEEFAREIARGMGTGARVEGSAIVVQGDQRERLVVWFGERGFAGAVAGN